MNNNPIQSNTMTPIHTGCAHFVIHTHNLAPLELQAVGGAIRLGRRSVFDSRIMQEMSCLPPTDKSESPGDKNTLTLLLQ